MNKVDKWLVFVLSCFIAALFICFDEVKQLKETIQTKAICERYDLNKKTHAFDVKSKIITIQCEVKL